ncbi:glycosyltransferase family 2 protein [Nocardia puris]|uniref:glycosyltransferase family 2 protein n=1 Tax=Nocardia puris TaxID=208602 RepID=UPI0018951D98|nr:glycosyltransferase family A protein [Nocardia puris]MBF6213761.1 glycosyltransferase family 2 protein [Nocardia puris]
MDLAVVTSVWGDHSRFLGQWADSILDQTHKPTQAVIADLGATWQDLVHRAAERLTTAGIDARVETSAFTGMGAARNTAVAATTTEWVMHLDADDVLLPYSLADVATLSDHADVVSLGALIGNQSRCFPEITAEQILNHRHGCYSCSPFRRTLWEQRPWHTRNDFIDSTLWVGFAHLGARFTGTTRPGFIYRQHEGSFSHTLTPVQRRIAAHQWLTACREWTLT